jgi:hypothetical protein
VRIRLQCGERFLKNGMNGLGKVPVDKNWVATISRAQASLFRLSLYPFHGRQRPDPRMPILVEWLIRSPESHPTIRDQPERLQLMPKRIPKQLIRPPMRFVSIKTDEQLDLQSLHRVLERWIVRRTAVVNRIRCSLLERGVAWRWLTSWHVLHGLCSPEARSTALLF